MNTVVHKVLRLSVCVLSAAGFTLVVTGNATWAQLRELAAALYPVAR